MLFFFFLLGQLQIQTCRRCDKVASGRWPKMHQLQRREGERKPK